MAFQNLFHFPAEVSFYFKDETADTLVRTGGLVAQDLFRVRIHTAGSFSASHSSQNCDAGEQSTFRNREPFRSRGGTRAPRVVYFAHDDKQIVAFLGLGIRRQTPRHNTGTNPERANVGGRQHSEIGDGGGGE